MSQHFLQIDVSNSKCKESENEMIKISIKNEDVLQVNFANFFIQSKYIRDKYQYSEALLLISTEFEKMRSEFNVSYESIKYFIQLVQQEKVNIPIEQFKNLYILSEYFNIPKFTNELEKIYMSKLNQDLSFNIQILIDMKTMNNKLGTKLTIKAENFLSDRINECFENRKFSELSAPTIYRIVNGSKEENINYNLLVDFIINSIDTRFTLLRLIKLEKLTDDKLDEFINFLDKQNEDSKKKYLEYMPFSILFIKQMKNDYDKLFKEFNQLKEKLNHANEERGKLKEVLNQANNKEEQMKEELDRKNEENKKMKEELDHMKEENKNVKEELNQANNREEQMKEELNQINEENKKMKGEIDQMNEDNKKMKEELDQMNGNNEKIKEELIQANNREEQMKEELDQANEEKKKMKEEQEWINEKMKQIKSDIEQISEENKNIDKEVCIKKDVKNQMKEMEVDESMVNNSENDMTQNKRIMIVCGYDNFNQLGAKPNNKNEDGLPIIFPPVRLAFDPSSLLSYSAYRDHSVLVTCGGSLLGVGDNSNGRISSLLPKGVIDHYTEFAMKDRNGDKLVPVSALCCAFGTLYMLSGKNGSGKQLVLCDEDINNGYPTFLDIGNQQPVGLFGGCSHAAVIGSEGQVIFINRHSIKKSPDSPIEGVSLPFNEKASSVACCEKHIFVLSSKGHVFESLVTKESSVLKFSIVTSLEKNEIVCLSGTHNHCIVVTKEGLVFARGSNDCGQLGLGQINGINLFSTFTQVLSLRKRCIRAAYAGTGRSFFETCEGSILSCGRNYYGELLLSSGPSEDINKPSETIVNRDATFCIAGNGISAIFFGNSQPPNTPNLQIRLSQ